MRYSSPPASPAATGPKNSNTAHHGAVPVAPLRVRAWVERPGKRIALCAAEMLAQLPDGGTRPVARVSAWLLTTSDTGDTTTDRYAPLAEGQSLRLPVMFEGTGCRPGRTSACGPVAPSGLTVSASPMPRCSIAPATSVAAHRRCWCSGPDPRLHRTAVSAAIPTPAATATTSSATAIGRSRPPRAAASRLRAS